jgi:hypothetical protein
MIARRLRDYLTKLEKPKIILWCYFCWYAAIVIQYFDASLSLWMSSVGISILVGYALNIAAQSKGQQPDRWVTFRLYLFPFCVSSFAATIKDKGFFLLFPTQPIPHLVAFLACASFLICIYVLKRFR